MPCATIVRMPAKICDHARPLRRYKSGKCVACVRARNKAQKQNPEAVQKRKDYYKIKDQEPERKAKHKIRNDKYRAKEESLEVDRRRRGIKDPELVAEVLKFQGNKCAICPRVDWGARRRPSADHDHKTGLLRGLLCSACNAGIGMLQDNPHILAAAFEYLIDPPAAQVRRRK